MSSKLKYKEREIAPNDSMQNSTSSNAKMTFNTLLGTCSIMKWYSISNEYHYYALYSP